MSHIQGIRNLKELYNYKFEGGNSQGTAQYGSAQQSGYTSARVKLPVFISQAKKNSSQTGSNIVTKKSLNSSKPNSRNGSIYDNSSLNNNNFINVSASKNYIAGNSNNISGQPSFLSGVESGTLSCVQGNYLGSSQYGQQGIGAQNSGINKGIFGDKSKAISLHFANQNQSPPLTNNSQINSNFQSPLPSPNNLSLSQQFVNKGARRDYSHHLMNQPGNSQQSSGFPIQIGGYSQQLAQQQLMQHSNQQQQIFAQQQQYYQPQSILNAQLEQKATPSLQSYSRSNSRQDRSVDKNAETNRIDSHRPDSNRDRSTSKSNQQQQQQQNPTPPSFLQSHRQKQEQQQNQIDKFKGSSFLNYAFLNNFQAGSQTVSKNASKNSTRGQESRSDSRQHERQEPSAPVSNNTSQIFASPIQQDAQNASFRQTVQELYGFGTMNRNMYNFHYVVGKGGFGKVWKVDNKKTRKVFAMKEMSKSKIITKRSVNSVMSERQLLSQLKNPFLVNMNFAFQDRDNLYLIMDLLTGGDLRFHIGKQRRFSEVQTRFFIACMMICLEYLHINNIIHRDIKPENLVLDDMGYVRVTDLGIARVWKPENAQDTSGTPGYMAPEVMCRQNHGIAVDYFAVGVIGYEFMMGRRPYLGRSRKEIRDQILAKQVQIKKHEIPDGWSIEAADFINRMIQRKPMNRLGINGPDEVKDHPWLKNFPWDKLLNKEIESPFIPQSIEDNFDYRQQISDDKETNEDLNQQNGLLLRRNSVQSLFAGYNFDGSQQGNQQISSGNRTTGSTAATHNTHSDRSNSALQQYIVQNANMNSNTNNNSSSQSSSSTANSKPNNI